VQNLLRTRRSSVTRDLRVWTSLYPVRLKLHRMYSRLQFKSSLDSNLNLNLNNTNTNTNTPYPNLLQHQDQLANSERLRAIYSVKHSSKGSFTAMTGFDFSNHRRNAALHARGVPLPKATSTGTTIVGCIFDGGVVVSFYLKNCH
jgi:hypothetical protein